jgi:hypothetical protein
MSILSPSRNFLAVAPPLVGVTWLNHKLSWSSSRPSCRAARVRCPHLQSAGIASTSLSAGPGRKSGVPGQAG